MPSEDYLKSVLRVSQERMHTLKDVYQAGPYFFTEPNYSLPNMTDFRKAHPSEVIGIDFLKCILISLDAVLRHTIEKISVVEEWNARKISYVITQLGKELDLRSKVVMRVLRYALAGLESGVGVPVIMEILGKNAVNRRLENCRSYQGD
jgi:glutamyl/glutaminyl-tRNA synthetase